MSQGALAKAAGMAQPTIWRLVSGNASGTTRVFDIARALNINAQWLSTGEGPMRPDHHIEMPDNSELPPVSQWQPVKAWDASTPVEDDEVEVPFLKDIEFACGDGRVNEEDYNGFKLRFSKATLRKVGASTDGSSVLCFPARGDSMEPAIPDGTTVAVNILDKRIVDGKIYAINENGWKRIKLLYRTGPDSVSIKSYNQEIYPPENKSLSDVEVIGRVFWYSVLL